MRSVHQFPFPETMGEMAKKCHVTRVHLVGVLHHRLKCSPELAMAIDRETKGAIPKGSLRRDIWPSHDITPSEPAA